jgi:hypothetical protein
MGKSNFSVLDLLHKVGVGRNVNTEHFVQTGWVLGELILKTSRLGTIVPLCEIVLPFVLTVTRN